MTNYETTLSKNIIAQYNALEENIHNMIKVLQEERARVEALNSEAWEECNKTDSEKALHVANVSNEDLEAIGEVLERLRKVTEYPLY